MRLKSRIYRMLPDSLYLKIRYQRIMGKPLKLKTPQTFNEKLQWLKLYDRKPEYTMMVDKYAMKQYVADKIGAEYIIPAIGVWEHFDEIDFRRLPERFVLKCTHDSGGVVVCRDRKSFDRFSAKEKLEGALASNFYWPGREWPYKGVKPRILAEPLIEDSSGGDLMDYKLYCFNGVPKIVLICSQRFGDTGLKEDFFDDRWNHMNCKKVHHDNAAVLLPLPEKRDLMFELAGVLSESIPFIRVDFYEVEGRVYVGELTFFPSSGFEDFEPDSWNYRLGSWITLPGKEMIADEA